MLKHIILRVPCPWKWSAQKRGKRLIPTGSHSESRVKLDRNVRTYSGRVRARMWKAEWKTSLGLLCLPKSNSFASDLERKSQRTMRDRANWTIHSSQDQVTQPTEILATERNETIELEKKLQIVECERDHLRPEIALLQLQILGRGELPRSPKCPLSPMRCH
jgi:hypothetical protein